MDKIDIADFWKWAYSDILNNTTRGKLAEYLVFTACKSAGLDIKQCSYWDSWDLEIVGGPKIEVKSSGWYKTWGNHKTTPSFSIKPAKRWNQYTGKYEGEKKRQSDVYVFAVNAYKGIDEDEAMKYLLDYDKWKFIVAKTLDINSQYGDAKSVSWANLIEWKEVTTNQHLAEIIKGY